MTPTLAQPRPRAAAPRYVVTLRAEPGDVPADVRLRRALKCLGRAFNLKCLDIREIKPPGRS